jgi:hypothetical protein
LSKSRAGNEALIVSVRYYFSGHVRKSGQSSFASRLFVEDDDAIAVDDD